MGAPLPLGAHLRGTGVNFAVFSRHATAVSLLLFGEPQDSVPRLTIALDPQYNRSGDIWHLWVNNIGPGILYAWLTQQHCWTGNNPDSRSSKTACTFTGLCDYFNNTV